MQSISMEDLNKLHNTFIRHSGVGQNQVKIITYWMLACASMTENVLNQSSLTIKMATK